MSEKKWLDAMDRWLEQRRQEMIEDVLDIVAIPSVSEYGHGDAPFGRECVRVLEHALALGEKYGFSARNYDNYCGTLTWGEQQEEIGLFAHLDVVEAAQPWQVTAPFEPCVRDGYIFGRGADDDKAPAVVMLYVLRFFREMNIPLKHRLMLCFGCGEELNAGIGMEDMLHFRACAPSPRFSLVPDSRFPLGHGEKGVFEAELRSRRIMGNLMDFQGGEALNYVAAHASAHLCQLSFAQASRALEGLEGICVEGTDQGVLVSATGQAAHSSTPGEGESAIDKLARVLLEHDLLRGDAVAAVGALARLSGDTTGGALGVAFAEEKTGSLTCIVSKVRMQDNYLIATIDIRFPFAYDSDRLARDVTGGASKLGLHCHILDNDPGYYLDLTHPAIQPILDISREETGIHDMRPAVLGGPTYARKLENAISLGPDIPTEPRLFDGKKGWAHGVDEYISLDCLMKTFRVYVRSILAIDEII